MATNPASEPQQSADSSPLPSPTGDKALRTSLERAKKNLTETKRWIGSEALFLVLSIAGLIWKSSGIWHGIAIGLAVIFLIALVSSIGDLYTNRQRIIALENDLAAIELERELSKMGDDNTLKAAERMLRTSNAEVRRYYDLNLSQNRSILRVGMVCILVGFGIISYAFHVILNLQNNVGSSIAGSPKDAIKTEVVTAVLAGIGTILANYVAVIYLKMNSSANDNMGVFHSRLVVTQQLMLGNMVASRINDKTEREKTFAAMALKMIPGKDA